MTTKVKHIFQLIILSGLMFSCAKTQDQIVPNVRVNIDFSPNLPQFYMLTSPGNAYKYPSVGYNQNGIIIYRNSMDEFTAFDATCPQHIDISTSVILNDGGSGGLATCPHCHTVYYLYNYGAPTSGYSLRQYYVTNSGGNSYHISN